MGKDLHNWRRGDAITSARLNELRDAILSVVTGGAGIAVRAFGNRLVIEATGVRALPSMAYVRRFRVQSVENDYLVCRPYHAANESLGDTDVNVAKPYELRRTPFHAQTIAYPGAQSITYTYASQREREADDGTDTETQVMIPDYWDDDEILAVRNIAGGTGVTVSEVALVWEDLNTAGRMWAKESA